MASASLMSSCRHRRRRHARIPQLASLLTSLVVLLAGCGDRVAPYTVVAPQEASGAFWDLTLDHHAVTLATVAPYDTIRLTATPRDGHGVALADLGAVTFRTLDSTRVQVGADGIARALRSGSGIRIVAELAAQGLRHADTVFITITTGTPARVPADVFIQPVPPDSAKWVMEGTGQGLLGFKTLTARVVDATGALIAGIPIDYRSSDETRVTIDRTGRVTGKQPGEVMIRASARVYGVSVMDTIPFTMTMRLGAEVRFQTSSIRDVGLVFEPSEVRIAPGGNVQFWNLSSQQVDVTFDDPTNVAQRDARVLCLASGFTDPPGAGNIAQFGSGTNDRRARDASGLLNCRSRRFPVPGVYPFRSTLTGATGRVIVSDNLETP